MEETMVEVAEDGTLTCPWCNQSGLSEGELKAHIMIEMFIRKNLETKIENGQMMFRLKLDG